MLSAFYATWLPSIRLNGSVVIRAAYSLLYGPYNHMLGCSLHQSLGAPRMDTGGRKMNTWKRISVILILGLSLVVSACGPGQIFSPTFTPTPTITLTPTSTPTPTPTPTPTLTPSPTPTPIGGGLGQLVFAARRCQTWPSCDFSIYKYDLQSRQSSLLFEGFYLEGISPDGNKLLVFSVAQVNPEKYELYTVNLDGSSPILLHNNFYLSTPRWLPGTDWIAFIAFEGGKTQVFVIHPDGTGLTQVTHSNIGVIDILPSFDGGIYWEEGHQTGRNIYSSGFRWTRLDGSETKKLDDWNDPSISIDGNYVAYVNEGDLCEHCSVTITKIDGSEAVTIPIENLQLSEAMFVVFDGVAWLPNSVEVIAKVILCNTECDETRYFLFSLSGELLRELPPEANWIPNISGMYTWPWSPDGRSFIFQGYEQTDTGGRTTQNMYEMDTGQVKVIEFGLEPELDVYKVFWLPHTP